MWKSIRAGKAADVKIDIEVQNLENRVLGKEGQRRRRGRTTDVIKHKSSKRGCPARISEEIVSEGTNPRRRDLSTCRIS